MNPMTQRSETITWTVKGRLHDAASKPYVSRQTTNVLIISDRTPARGQPNDARILKLFKTGASITDGEFLDAEKPHKIAIQEMSSGYRIDVDKFEEVWLELKFISDNKKIATLKNAIEYFPEDEAVNLDDQSNEIDLNAQKEMQNETKIEELTQQISNAKELLKNLKGQGVSDECLEMISQDIQRLEKEKKNLESEAEPGAQPEAEPPLKRRRK